MNENNILAIVLFAVIAFNSKNLVRKMLSAKERTVKILCAIAFSILVILLIISGGTE